LKLLEKDTTYFCVFATVKIKFRCLKIFGAGTAPFSVSQFTFSDDANMTMQTSCVRHPQRSRYLKIHDWQLEATGGDQAGAALINFFTYHHDRLLDNQQINRAVNGELTAAAPVDDKGWQFHTDAFIEQGLLGLWKRDAIRKGLAALVRIGFLEDTPPEGLRRRYRVGRVKGFRFRADRVRVWLDAYTARQHPAPAADAAFALSPAADPAPPVAKTPRAKPVVDDLKDVDTYTLNDAREIFDDWREVHDHPAAVATPERLRYIIKLLKRGYTVARLKTALRGVLFSPWHQGANDRKKVWDKISIIFEDGEKVEEFEELALKAGVTEQNLTDARFYKKPRAARPLDKPDWQRAIDNCPLCDEKGRVEKDGAITICTHPKEPIHDGDTKQATDTTT
jgi:hypothetical protein